MFPPFELWTLRHAHKATERLQRQTHKELSNGIMNQFQWPFRACRKGEIKGCMDEISSIYEATFFLSQEKDVPASKMSTNLKKGENVFSSRTLNY